MENLSAKAREEYNKLQQKLQDIISADRQREPKLTDGEKAEIAACEARLEKNRLIYQRILDQEKAKDERLTYLEQNTHKIVIDGGDVDELVAEIATLRPAYQLLMDVSRDVNIQIASDELQIKHIKEKAREREIRQEAQNGR